LRNYVLFYFTKWVNDSGVNGYGIGPTQALARSQAGARAGSYFPVSTTFTNLGGYRMFLDKFTLWGMFLIVGNAGAPGTDANTVTDGQVAAFCGCRATAAGLKLDPQKVPPRNFSVAKGYVAKKGGGQAVNLTISLKSYLLLLLNTWEGTGQALLIEQPGTKREFAQVPQRWIDWLKLLIDHYDRYTPTQIYGFLALVDFSKPTFKV
jgi:hypothetical protein